ncbi:MAG: L,D-transpeptidase family protein, partial [Ginsengibacter sp.]
MSKLFFKFLLFLFFVLANFNFSFAQNSFLMQQKNASRVTTAFVNNDAKLQKEFEAKGLQWPAKYVYIRSFKFDSQLEVWVKNNPKEKYSLFKSYRVCMQSGTMGPKRLQGDYQVPEGFYYINEFNPHSNYHLSLRLNYPNASDRILSDSLRPGNDIYIHGNCVSVGCVAVTDNDIEEIYVLTSYARDAGQEFIPVHIFPIKYDNKKSVDYFNNSLKNNPSLEAFSKQLKRAYDEFNETKQVPLILIDRSGDYVVN